MLQISKLIYWPDENNIADAGKERMNLMHQIKATGIPGSAGQTTAHPVLFLLTITKHCSRKREPRSCVTPIVLAGALTRLQILEHHFIEAAGAGNVRPLVSKRCLRSIRGCSMLRSVIWVSPFLTVGTEESCNARAGIGVARNHVPATVLVIVTRLNAEFVGQHRAQTGLQDLVRLAPHVERRRM